MIKRFTLALLAVCCLLFVSPAQAAEQEDEIFTGQKRMACEALLCLSSPHRPSECNPSINYYYSIRRYKDGSFSASRTRSARQAFLNQCPDGDAYVQGLAGVIGNTLNRCDAGYLNQRKVFYGREYDVPAGRWSAWKVIGRDNGDYGGSRFTLSARRFPACTPRQLDYRANLAAGRERPLYEDGALVHPVPLQCFETRSEIDPAPPGDCQNLYRSDYTYYQGLKYENGSWVHRD